MTVICGKVLNKRAEDRLAEVRRIMEEERKSWLTRIVERIRRQ